jgi:DNA-binding MarR family transcriptional regulator
MTLDTDQIQGLAGFRLALRQFVSASESISRAGGVTQQQYQALLAIRAWPDGPMHVGDLAGQLLLTHHAAVQLIDRLESAGLALRTPSPDDRRSVLLSLTPAGRERVEELAAQHLEQMQAQEPLLTESLRRLRRIQR